MYNILLDWLHAAALPQVLTTGTYHRYIPQVHTTGTYHRWPGRVAQGAAYHSSFCTFLKWTFLCCYKSNQNKLQIIWNI